MENKTYFVKLKPNALFFFGGEQGETADYYLKGSLLPQQTALLGFVRHQILIQNNLLKDNKINDDNQAIEYIGEGSFEYDKEKNFGKIKTLSPLHLVRNIDGLETKFLPFPLEFTLIKKVADNNHFLPKYDPKKNYSDRWKAIDKDECVELEKIFCKVIRPGVDKNYKGDLNENDNAYYKQEWLKLNSDFSFGFYVTLTSDVSLNSRLAYFGKEVSFFKMEVSLVTNTSSENNISEYNALYLTCDAYLEKDVSNLVEFSISDTVFFRNTVSSTSKNTNYHHFGKGFDKSKKKLQLYKRGSIFYGTIQQLKNLAKEIDSYTNFKNIGYNQYSFIKINSI